MERLTVAVARRPQPVLTLEMGDLTRERVDAIVNAANPSLLGGGGVDGAIHRAGGPAILEACRKLGGCATGEAKLTTGGDLPARFVIHTVGPIYRDGRHDEARLLASAYTSSLVVAEHHGLRTIAFPAISTGAYRFPIKEAAPIALRTVYRHLSGSSELEEVRFLLFSASDYAVYSHALQELAREVA